MNITEISKANGKDAVSIQGFTNDQLNAYKTLIDFINKPFDKSDYKRALVGPAGTGKTYLVKAIIKNCNLSYSTIGLSAPTHKACRVLNDSIGISNININSLQSDLGLRLNFDVDKFDLKNPPFDPKGRIKIENYRLYIVDESSMINRDLVIFLEKICITNNCKIIYIGDASQLPPVNEKFSSAFKGIKTCKLKQIVRQGEDNPISYLLELLRFDIEHKSFTFLDYITKNNYRMNEDNTKGYQVCNNEQFEDFVYRNFSDEELTKNVDFAKVIAYTNTCVSSWNKFIRNTIIKDADKSIITKNDLLISYTTLVNQFNDCIIKNSEEYILKDVVNYTHPKYNLKGFMVKFIAIYGGRVTSPLFIVDHKDKFTINMYVKLARQFVQDAYNAPVKFRAQKWKDYYNFKESCLLLTNIIKPNPINRFTTEIEFSRDLDYGFSLTSHKSQGSTFDTALVDVNNIVFDKFGRPYASAEDINRRLYVACSRAKNKLYLKYGK